MSLKETFAGKTVLVTGHTGFKGSWLSYWLLLLGARVIGYSLDEELDSSSLFLSLGLQRDLVDVKGDIRNREYLLETILRYKPDYIFHLAAQPLVRRSYQDPLYTFETNTLGSVYVAYAASRLEKKCTTVFITSDKVYENVEQLWGYRETDRIGGKDPYSASKGAAEILLASYASYMADTLPSFRYGIGRAGNVIGGGDRSKDRLIPDIVRAWESGNTLVMRSPDSTRPWQHVLEPLSGYMSFAAALNIDHDLIGEAFNFGPSDTRPMSVKDVAIQCTRELHSFKFSIEEEMKKTEAGLLQLDCNKALKMLNWSAILSAREAISWTADWYLRVHEKESAEEVTKAQISKYERRAQTAGAWWCK